MIKQIFFNLAVKDLNKSVEFFTKLGFKFNPEFTDQNAACLIVSKNVFSMLITENLFKSFTKKQICDTNTSIEGLFALQVGTRKKVDDLVKKAVESGAKTLEREFKDRKKKKR